MVSAYEYNPLPSSDSIRLFILQPDSGDATINESLITISLSGTTSNFKALSHTWANSLDKGNPSYKPEHDISRSILCDERPMAVTENLHDALWQCHGKYASAPLSGVTDPYNRSLYIGRFLPTNLQLIGERQNSIPPSRQAGENCQETSSPTTHPQQFKGAFGAMISPFSQTRISMYSEKAQLPSSTSN
jgi:hypothetical protein